MCLLSSNVVAAILESSGVRAGLLNKNKLTTKPVAISPRLMTRDDLVHKRQNGVFPCEKGGWTAFMWFAVSSLHVFEEGFPLEPGSVSQLCLRLSPFTLFTPPHFFNCCIPGVFMLHGINQGWYASLSTCASSNHLHRWNTLWSTY